MNEFRRIFEDKKRILFILAILLLNIMFILKDNYELRDRSADYKTAVSEYRSMDIDAAYEQNQAYIEKYSNILYAEDVTDEERAEAVYYLSLHQSLTLNIEYVRGYTTKYIDMVENAGKMINIGLVDDKETFTYKNMRQTLIDFSDVDGLSVKLVADRTVNGFIDFEMTGYMVVLVVFVVVASFMEEQKKGLFYIVRSCVGRNRLVLTRQIVLLISSFVISGIFYGTAYALFGYIHGFVPLDTLIQSFPIFENCHIVMSIGQFLMLIVLLKAIVAYLLGNLLWTLMNLFNNMLVSIGMATLIMVSEYILYKNVASSALGAIFKYVNIFNYMSLEKIFMEYTNLDICGWCVGVIPFSIISLAIVVAIVGLMASVIASRKRYTLGRMSKVMYAIKSRIKLSGIEAHTKLYIHELYRYFICNGVLAIMIGFGVLMWLTYETPKIEYSLQQVYINNHYTYIEGELGETVDRYLKHQRAELEEDRNELRLYVEEHPEYESTIGYQNAENNLETRENALSYVEGENARLKQLAFNGYDVYHINSIGYKQIFNVSSISTYISYLIPIFFTVLISSTIFSYDNEYNFRHFLKATSKGRKYVLNVRIAYAIVCTMILCAIMNVIELYKVQSVYALNELDGALECLDVFAGTTSGISIGTAMAWMYSLRLFVLICVSFTSMCLSSLMQSNKLSYAINLVVLVLPASFVVIGVKLFGWISYMDVYMAHMNLTDVIMGNYVAIVPYVICLVIAIASFVTLRRKMC